MSDFESTLERIVSEKVSRVEYPPEMKECLDEINALISEKIKRPATKELYFARLSELNALVAGFKEEVELKYRDDMDLARKDPVNIKAANLICIEEDYSLQFSSLQFAYNAAMILNDIATMSSITAQYQALLGEYNKAIEAIL